MRPIIVDRFTVKFNEREKKKPIRESKNEGKKTKTKPEKSDLEKFCMILATIIRFSEQCQFTFKKETKKGQQKQTELSSLMNE